VSFESLMSTPAKTVRRFVNAWNTMDFDAVIDCLDENIYYHNIPMEPILGLDNVKQYLREAWVFTACHWELVNLAVNKETVLTERVDAFVIDGREVRLLLMGVFNVHNDKITVWRDYFDLASYQRQLHQA